MKWYELLKAIPDIQNRRSWYRTYSDSIKILAYKKICDSSNKCSNANVDQKFITDIKDNIINTARSIKIEEAKKNKK
jgi:hypothetical protein